MAITAYTNEDVQRLSELLPGVDIQLVDSPVSAVGIAHEYPYNEDPIVWVKDRVLQSAEPIVKVGLYQYIPERKTTRVALST